MKNPSSDNSPSKMHQILKKLETYKEIPSNTVHHPSLKKYKHSSSIRQSLNSINNLTQNTNNDNQVQKNQINIHKQALQTLTDAALNVQNLLSDFLVNVDPDDKRVYHIEDELKRIKHNNMENPINFYNFMKGKNSNSSDEENFNGNKNNFRKRKTSNFNKVKNMTIDQNDSPNLGFVKMKTKKKKKISNENYDDNNYFSKNSYERFLTNTNSLNKKIIRNSFSNENIINDPFNNIKKTYENDIENKNEKRRKFSNLSNNINKKINKVKFSDMKHQSSENILKNLNKDDILLNRKATMKSSNLKYKLFDLSDNEEETEIGDKNEEKKNKMMELRRKLKIENNELLKKRHSFAIPFHLSLKKKQTNKSLKDEIGKNDKTRSTNILKDYSKLQNYNEDKSDIRNYISLSKKGYEKFNNLCQNLRRSFIISPKDHLKIKENLNLENNYIRKKTAETANSDKIILNLERDKTFKNEEQDNLGKSIDKISNFSDSNDSDNPNKVFKELQFRRIIRQNKLVYDSLSDEELLEELEGEFYLNPNSYYVFIFDMILLFLSIYAIIIPPFVFAFHVDYSFQFHISIIMEFIIDSFFIVDFFLGFFRAYFDFDEQLISNNKSIIIHYFKTWFVLDLISGIPYNSLFILFVERVKKSNQNIILSYVSYKWKVSQLFRFLRLFKLFKTFTNNQFTLFIIEAINGIDVLVKWFALYISLFIFFSSVHLLSCIFIFLAQLEYPNWIYQNGFELNNQHFDIYITSFYYICATVFTIGYGDIVSVNIYERFFNLILLVVGIMIYSYAVSALSNYVQSVDSKTLDYQNKVTILKQIRVTHEKMPQELYDKISRFLLYRLNNETKDKNEIIDNLPMALRNKLIMEMYKNIINHFIFFKNFDNSDFIIRVILAFKPIQASKNERLVNEGDYLEEIIFVKRGKLALEIPLPVIIKEDAIKKMETMRRSRASIKLGFNKTTIIPLNPVTTLKNSGIPTILEAPTLEQINEEKELKKIENEIRPQQQYIKIIEIRRNEHFGDILMFLNKRSPLSVKVKSKVCELFLLKKTDAVEISMSFPRIWRKIIKKSLFNMEQIERLINKTLKFFFIHNEGLNNNGTIKENYFKRDPTMTNKFLNINTTNLMSTLQNNEEQYELQSIPTTENEEEYEDDEEETEEIYDESENNFDIQNQKKLKKGTNIKTVIKEVDENRENSEESENKSNEIKNSNNNSEDNSNTNESNFSNKEKTETTSKLSISSRRTNKTLLIDIKNELFDYFSDSFCEKDKEKGTYYSSNNRSLPYSAEEINNESIPFEEPIKIKEDENINSNLIPDSVFSHRNYNTHHIIVDEMLENIKNNNLQNDNNLLMLFNKTNSNKTDANTNSNNYNVNYKSSFNNISVQNQYNCNIHLKGKKLTHLQFLTSQFNHKDFNTNQNVTRTNSLPINMLPKNRLTKTRSFLKNSFNVDTPTSPVQKKRLSKLMFSQKERGKVFNIENETDFKNSNTINETPINNFKESSIIELVQSMGNISPPKRRRTTLKYFKNQPRNTNTFKSEALNNLNGIVSPSSDKKNMLDVISQNIEKNSLNLNNPHYFYSEYFSAVMNKTENKPKNNVTLRLKNIAKIIENNCKKGNSHMSSSKNNNEDDEKTEKND